MNIMKKLTLLLISIFIIGCSSDPKEDLCSCRQKIIRQHSMNVFQPPIIEYRAAFTLDCSEVVTDSVRTFDGVYHIIYLYECEGL